MGSWTAFFNLTLLAYECILLYYTTAIWPQKHSAQKAMLSWTLYSLCFGITARSLMLILSLVQLSFRNRPDTLGKLNWLFCLSFSACFIMALFQSGWFIVGIMRIFQMSHTNDPWFTYGIILELVISCLAGIIIYVI